VRKKESKKKKERRIQKKKNEEKKKKKKKARIEREKRQKRVVAKRKDGKKKGSRKHNSKACHSSSALLIPSNRHYTNLFCIQTPHRIHKPHLSNNNFQSLVDFTAVKHTNHKHKNPLTSYLKLTHQSQPATMQQ
jgi:hypothetical protein